MVKGVGIDICENKRIEKVLKKYGEKFIKRVFLEEEKEYAFSKKNPIPFLSARFAFKEAFLKDLGLKSVLHLPLNEVGLIGKERKKEIYVKGVLKKILEEKKIQKMEFSISHTKEYAVAVVILEGENGG